VQVDGEGYFDNVVFNDGGAQLHIGDRVSCARVSVTTTTDGDAGTIRDEIDSHDDAWTLDLTP
jgi:hypothetical protein